jgi:hypothetical protein
LITTSRLAAGALALMVIACQTASEGDGRGPVTGSWGGTHVGLVLGLDGGRLEYDCASGTIDGPLRTDSGGRFTARGMHVPGHGGPEREGDEPPRLPADYSGEVHGDRMILRVRMPSTGVEIGPLTLRRDVEPIIFRCL